MIERSRECERLINEIEPSAWDYAARKRYEKDSFRTFDARADLWDNLPDNWEPVAKGMLLAASVFTFAPRAAGFVRSVASVLSDSALKLVRQWRQDPWTYAAFRVVRDMEDSLLAVELLDSHDTLVLYSPAISHSFHDGTIRFIALLFTNGTCYQTYGVTIPLGAFDERDIRFFVEALDFANTAGRLSKPRAVAQASRSTSEQSWSDVIARNPVSFLGLFRYSGHPGIQFRGVTVEYAVGWTELEVDEKTRRPSLKAADVVDALATDLDTPELTELDDALQISRREADLPDGYAVTIAERHLLVNTFR